MRVLNRKRFSQRTNDLRAKAVLDFMAAPYGSDTMELLLFGRLIGLQPRQTANIHPGNYNNIYPNNHRTTIIINISFALYACISNFL